MKFVTMALAVGGALFTGGCAAPASAPLPQDHPAHPGAATTPAVAPSATLAAGEPVKLDGSALPQEHHDHAAHGAVTQPTAGARYTCPHHPNVVSAKPGECPECGMQLEPAKGKATGGHGEHQPSTSPTKPAAHDHSQHDHAGHGGKP